jgi:hypothetical protein
MLLSNESPKTLTALVLLALSLTVVLLGRLFVPSDSALHVLIQSSASVLVAASLWLLMGGYASLKRTPKQIAHDISLGQDKKKTLVQWICLVVAILTLAFAI